MWEYDAGVNSFVVPAWYVQAFRDALALDPGDAHTADLLSRFRPVPEAPSLFDMPEAALPPACDFHAELHDLTFPVPDPPPPSLVDRVLAVVRARL